MAEGHRRGMGRRPGRPKRPSAVGRARQVGLPGTNVGRGAESRRSDRVSRCQSAGAAEGVVGSMEAIMQNAPWNKGRLTGQKRPLKPKDVWAIRVRLQLKRRAHDLALFNLAIDGKLRGCDLVRLQVDDVCASNRVRDRATVIQKKTGRPVQFEITEQTRASIRAWVPEVDARKGQYLFPSRFRAQPHPPVDTPVCTDRPFLGREPPAWKLRLRHAFDEADEGGPDLQEDGQTFEPSNCSSGTRSSKARSAISASRWMTRSPFPSTSNCELK